jgi:hypothetical protein
MSRKQAQVQLSLYQAVDFNKFMRRQSSHI